MCNLLLRFPNDFSDCESELSVKGFFSLAILDVDSKCFKLNFYEPVRLAQEGGDAIASENFFYEPNLIVISDVTRENMEQAATKLYVSGQWKFLVRD